MTSAGLAHIQRLLAAEFERRGWEYDLSLGSAIAEEIVRTGTVDPPKLARLAPHDFLAKARTSRSAIADAIGAAVGGVELEPAGGAVVDGRTGMKVLFLAAGPADESRLRLDAEHRDIRERIRSSSARDQVVIETALAARPTDLIDELNRHRPTVLHLAGHGGPTGIALEDNAGNSADVTTEQLSRLVALADHSLRLVVLNSCDSAHQAKPVTAHVDAAIGMTRAVGDEAARTFAAQLYSSLAEGVPVDRAFEQARLQISLAGFREDKTPMLFVRAGKSAADLVFTA